MSPIVYVESPFVVELGFKQTHAEFCRALLRSAAAGAITLALPATAMVEPFFTQVERERRGRELDEKWLAWEKDLGKREPATYQPVQAAVMAARAEHAKLQDLESKGIAEALADIVACATILAVDGRVLTETARLRRLGLTAVDALALACILVDATTRAPTDERSLWMLDKYRKSKDVGRQQMMSEIQKATIEACMSPDHLTQWLKDRGVNL